MTYDPDFDKDDRSWMPKPLSFHVQEWRGKEPVPAMATGLQGLDTLLEGGFRPGEIVSVAAMTGFGKSAFALSIARNLAQQGYKVCFFTFEMAIQAVLARLNQQLTRVSARRIQSKNQGGEYGLDEQHFDIANKAMGHLENLPIFFSDGRFLKDVHKIQHYMEVLREEQGIDIFIFDYIQVMVHGDNKAAAIGETMAEIRAVAKNITNTPCLFLAQINRNVEHPSIYAIKDSHSVVIESDVAASLVTDVHKTDWDPSNVPFDLNVEKVRAGQSGIVPLTFIPQQVEFVDHVPS
jgi:replicative DNA helicase